MHLKTQEHDHHYLITVFIFVCLFALTSISASAQLLPSRKSGTVLEQLENSNLNNSTSSVVQDLLNYAFRFRGTPYRYGGSGSRGFDCSGFTSYVFKRFGINLNRSSGGQMSNGRRVSRNDLKPGDLVFFGGRGGRGRIGHVGIVTRVNEDDNTFHFIHSACSRGVTESKNTEAYYQRRYMGACRVIE